VHVGRQAIDGGLAGLQDPFVIGGSALKRMVFQDLVLELPINGAAEAIHRGSPSDSALPRAGSVARDEVLADLV